MRLMTAMVEKTANTHRQGAITPQRLKSAPRMTQTMRSGRYIKPTLQVPMSASARARV